MSRIRIPRPFAAIAIVSAVACSADPIVLCACSQVPPHTILYGSVTGPAGQVVPGTAVRVLVGPPDCGGGSPASVLMDEASRYSAMIVPTGGYTQQCIRVWATAPAESGFRDSDTLRLTLPTPASAGADSVRRDVVLRTL
jgi:hypothetical protein